MCVGKGSATSDHPPGVAFRLSKRATFQTGVPSLLIVCADGRQSDIYPWKHAGKPERPEDGRHSVTDGRPKDLEPAGKFPDAAVFCVVDHAPLGLSSGGIDVPALEPNPCRPIPA